jgi:hypothetical protein
MKMRRPLILAAVSLALAPASASAASFVQGLGSPYPVGSAPFGVVPTDFNGDGATDVGVVSGNNSTLSLYLRQPGGGFVQESGSPYAAVGDNFAASADFNGDTRPDVAVASYSGNYVTVLLRTAQGFSQEGTVIPVNRAGAIASADFNGDNRPDLAVADFDQGGLSILLRQPTGGFFFEDVSVPTGVNPRQIDVGDFNADGRPDLAVANFGSNTVTILLRGSTGGFVREGTDLPVGVRPYSVVAADFNQDGRPDIATADTDSDSVTVYHRNASGSGFSGATTIQVADGPTGVTAADFDGDGVNDIAVASFLASTVTVLRGGVTPEAPISVPGGAHQLEVANFDGTALPDLAVALNGAGQLAILLNTTAVPQPPPPPPPPPTPTPTPTLPEPVGGQTVNVIPVSGTVRIKEPRSNRYVTLQAGDQIPVGSRVDTRDGRVTLQTAGGGKADFFDGLFRITQSRGKRPLTTLTLTEQLDCRSARRASAAQKRKKPKSRKLWGSGSGRFRTTGNYSAATVRGTRWLVTDRCTSTTTRVRQGSVTVRDFVKRRSVIVRANRSYTARKRR